MQSHGTNEITKEVNGDREKKETEDGAQGCSHIKRPGRARKGDGKEQSEVRRKTERLVPWKPKEEGTPKRLQSSSESNASEITTKNWSFYVKSLGPQCH